MNNYAKLINNALTLAPNPIIVGDRQIGNPPAEVYEEQGYKPVRYTESPTVEPGFVAVPGWEEQADAIVQTWHAEPDGDIDPSEALDILLGGDEA